MRERELEQVELWVAREEQARQVLITKINQHDAAMARAMAEYNRLADNGEALRIEISQGASDVMHRLRVERANVMQHLAVQEQRCVQVKELLKTAHIRKKSLEHLKEKARKAFDLKQLKDEEVFLAELTQNRFIRDQQQQQKEQKTGLSKTYLPAKSEKEALSLWR